MAITKEDMRHQAVAYGFPGLFVGMIIIGIVSAIHGVGPKYMNMLVVTTDDNHPTTTHQYRSPEECEQASADFKNQNAGKGFDSHCLKIRVD